MFAEQRHQHILQILDTRGSVTLTELVRLLNASESTIDLANILRSATVTPPMEGHQRKCR
jgi:DeoR/GlpR family transcriptional regulator of sugar metabolism